MVHATSAHTTETSDYQQQREIPEGFKQNYGSPLRIGFNRH